MLHPADAEIPCTAVDLDGDYWNTARRSALRTSLKNGTLGVGEYQRAGWAEFAGRPQN